MAKHRKAHHSNKKKKLYSAAALSAALAVPESFIRKYFPAPDAYGKNGDRPLFWTSELVEETLHDPRIAAAIERSRRLEAKRANELADIREYLVKFDVEKLRRRAVRLDRRFVLHIGPTNSGKTYQALQALKAAETGVYLGPLRLLALEMFDTMNRDGVPCSLLTGEETIDVFNSYHTSSTIELADYTQEYDVAVIDEAQLVTDPYRGDKWFRAIYCIRAKEVHICLAPEARDLVTGMLESFGAPYTVQTHERLAPLVYSGMMQSLNEVQKGDALIVFSRRAVLAVSAELEKFGIHASVIYGALPPVSRREEVRRFTSGETQVVVATDAIGMGVSLPIRRVVFCEITKFDGQKRRPLNSGEIKQVAGRAGRYGMFDVGEVLTMADGERVENALTCTEEQKESLILPFPEEAFLADYPPEDLLGEWNRLPSTKGISRVDMSDAIILYTEMNKRSRSMVKRADRRTLYHLITCPVDTGDPDMIGYWLDCCTSILHDRELPEPPAGTDSLKECESRYKQLDIRHQLLRQIGIEEDRMQEKIELCEKINRYLNENKDDFIRRCRQCGRPLSATSPYSVCERCFGRRGRVYTPLHGVKGIAAKTEP